MEEEEKEKEEEEEKEEARVFDYDLIPPWNVNVQSVPW